MLIAVDTGGTKTLIARFEENGTIEKSVKLATPKDQQTYVATIRQILQQDFSDKPTDTLVIALPGIVKDGVAIWCDNLGWKDFDAYHAFEGVFAGTPVLIENDANLAGLSETRALNPTPVSSLYVTISTGIGTGFITNGRIDQGLQHSEGGHMLIEFNGKIQEWEDVASGSSIFKTYKTYAKDITSDATWTAIADRISRGFLALIPIAQPDVIIIGGSIGTYFSKYETSLYEILNIKLPKHIPCPQFLQAAHPEEAVIYGCYYYALDYLAD